MVLGGRVNKGLVSLIQQAGGKAVGLCGKDGDLLRARQMVEKSIGWVGGGCVGGRGAREVYERHRDVADGVGRENWGGWVDMWADWWSPGLQVFCEVIMHVVTKLLL
jgi:hypothetical protein